MNKKINFSTVFLLPFALIFAIWLVYWVELRFGFNFNQNGILPRSFSGLQGVFFSPFIHSSVEHLYHNSIPLYVLLSALFYFYSSISYRVLLFGGLAVGLLTWLIGRESYHIGASGLVYMLTSFLFFKGIWSKNYRLTALSLIVVFLYGSMVWGVFPQEERISWEGHLSGLLIGVLLALSFKVDHQPIKKYAWEEDNYKKEDDPFLQQFDEKGNFIPASELEASEDASTNDSMSCSEDVEVRYIQKEKK